MGIPEDVVHMAVSYQLLSKGRDFDNATELYSAAEILLLDPVKQAEVTRLLLEAHRKKREEEAKNKNNSMDEAASSAVDSLIIKEKHCIVRNDKVTTAKADTEAQLKERVKDLAWENHRLRQRALCRKCKDKNLAASGVTFLPCGHFIMCEACSDNFEDCPACGKGILGSVKTFLS